MRGRFAPVRVEERPDSPGGADVGGTRIVVGYDGSDDAVRAVRWAAAQARARNATLEVVHAYDYPYLERLGADTQRQLRDEAAAVAHDGRRRALDVEPDLDVVATVTPGGTASVLVERAADAELLVVGHQGANPGHHRILGSTATRCVQHAACSVVVVR